MAVVRKRVWQLTGLGGFRVSKSKVSSSFERATYNPFSVPSTRLFSELVKSNGKRLFLVDTLALVRRLEGEGIPSKHAEAITAAITEVLNDSLENVSQLLVSKGEMQKTEMIQEANLSKFKAEVQSSQGHHFSLLQHETEKLRNDIEKMDSELRNGIKKMDSELRNGIEKMDSELRNGIEKMDIELRNGIDKMGSELRNGIDSELRNGIEKMGSELRYEIDKVGHSLGAQIEAFKYDIIKYYIGSVASISAVGLAVLLIWK